MKQSLDFSHWQPPAHWTRITAIDMHTGGEPLRVYTSGLPPIEGRTVLEKRRYFREHYDHIRTATMWEPRGHASCATVFDCACKSEGFRSSNSDRRIVAGNFFIGVSFHHKDASLRFAGQGLRDLADGFEGDSCQRFVSALAGPGWFRSSHTYGSIAAK